MMPILVGTDGVQKMSKSLGNYVALEEPPAEMYGKLMSLPDSLIASYYEYLTDVPDSDIAEMRQAMASESANPMDFKKGLARYITAVFHDADAANAAESHFEQVVQRRDLPDDMPEVSLVDVAGLSVSRLLVQIGLASSNGEARRLINQGSVRIHRASGTHTTHVTQLAPEHLPLNAGDLVSSGDVNPRRPPPVRQGGGVAAGLLYSTCSSQA